MKRKVMALAVLLLYVLTACTFLSGKIQQEMATLVEVTHRDIKKNFTSVSIRAVYSDDSGDHLYEVRDDGGWESGLRFYEVEQFLPTPSFNAVQISGIRRYSFVLSSSKTPVVGERAQIVQDFTAGPDTYLLLYGRLFPPELVFAEGLDVAGVAERSVLLKTQNGRFPFFPHSLKTTTNAADLAVALYSLEEAQQLLRQAPAAVLACMVLLSGVVLLAAGWLLSGGGRRRWPLVVNGVLAAACMGLGFWLLRRIDLPSSMLPPRSILDMAHYRQTYGLLLDRLAPYPQEHQALSLALEQMAGAMGQTVRMVLLGNAALVTAQGLGLAGYTLAKRRKQKNP